MISSLRCATLAQATVAALLVAVVMLQASHQIVSADDSTASASASEPIPAAGERVPELKQADGGGQAPLMSSSPLDRLKQSIAAIAGGHPGQFDPSDLENFFKDEGTTSAVRFLQQRGGNSRRASKLAQTALKWRRELNLNQLEASQFPCELFKMGLIFESGRAHQRDPATGLFVATNPVIWVRLGALGSIIKQMERMSPARVLSYAYNTPRAAMSRVHQALSAVRHRSGSQLTRADRRAARQARRHVKNMSAASNESLQQVLKSIAWWLEDWVRRNPRQRATMVLDFENTDFALASWSTGEFFVKLDDMFPDLFDQILGFRYKAKLWSLHSPISMFNRIFKSRVSSSPETDRKLKFVNSEPQISAYVPRVDANGYTLLPDYVSGLCQAPDDSKAPAGCRQTTPTSNDAGLYNTNFWQAISNEFYHTCKARTN